MTRLCPSKQRTYVSRTTRKSTKTARFRAEKRTGRPKSRSFFPAYGLPLAFTRSSTGVTPWSTSTACGLACPAPRITINEVPHPARRALLPAYPLGTGGIGNGQVGICRDNILRASDGNCREGISLTASVKVVRGLGWMTRPTYVNCRRHR